MSLSEYSFSFFHQSKKFIFCFLIFHSLDQVQVSFEILWLLFQAFLHDYELINILIYLKINCKFTFQRESYLYRFFYNHYNCFLLSSLTTFPIWTGEPIPANYILSFSGIKFLGLIWFLRTYRCFLCYSSLVFFKNWSLY